MRCPKEIFGQEKERNSFHSNLNIVNLFSPIYLSVNPHTHFHLNRIASEWIACLLLSIIKGGCHVIQLEFYYQLIRIPIILDTQIIVLDDIWHFYSFHSFLFSSWVFLMTNMPFIDIYQFRRHQSPRHGIMDIMWLFLVPNINIFD